MLQTIAKDNQKRIEDLIESFKGENAKIIGVPAELIHFLGDTSKAVLLSQLIYWSDRGSRKDGLIFKKYKEIFNETGIKHKTCNRYYKEFKKMGFFDWDVKKANGSPTVHFKLDMDKLTKSLEAFWENQNGQIDQKEKVKMSESLTENTTENNNINGKNINEKQEEKKEENANVKGALLSFNDKTDINQNISDAVMDIYKMTLISENDFYLFNFEDMCFYSQHTYGDKYSEETIIQALQELYDLGVFAVVDRYIFNYRECQNSSEFLAVVKDCLLHMGLVRNNIEVASTSSVKINLRELWKIDEYNSEKELHEKYSLFL